MDKDEILEELTDDAPVEFGAGHRFGRMMFSGAVGFVASHMADTVYDKAVLALRARRGR